MTDDLPTTRKKMQEKKKQNSAIWKANESQSVILLNYYITMSVKNYDFGHWRVIFYTSIYKHIRAVRGEIISILL